MIIPERFKDASLDQLDSAVFPMVPEYAASLHAKVQAGVGLLLSGPSGVGKTFAVAALTRKYMERLKPGRVPSVIFHTIYQVMETYAPVVGPSPIDSERNQPWTTTYENCRWLVLNDLGKEYRGGRYIEQVSYKVGRLLRARSERGLVTHVTTNLPLRSRDDHTQTFEMVYGEATWSLCAESMDRYEVDGPDLRGEVR